LRAVGPDPETVEVWDNRPIEAKRMCGLAALVALKSEPADAGTLSRMLGSIVHRGPDDSGIEIDGPVGLGFRRLSILDLSPHGHQPMSAPDGQQTIVFNGEIYNYLELRADLQALGHRFQSTGDTEVLLAAYRQWGPSCLERLNGMWAFVIKDRARKLVFGSRDRFGMKPLYRWSNDRHFAFASEIKSIRASGLYRGELNRRAAAAFLYDIRLDETDETFLEGIVAVPPGHAFELALDGGYREWPFWHLNATTETHHPDPAGAFAELFENTIGLHLRSDVPVGVNLSGGLDSSSILCATARLRAAAGANAPLMAFCYLDKTFDERRYIDDTLAQTGARMVPLTLSPRQLWDSLPQVLAAQDEPMHAMSALIGYHLFKLAREHGVKVVLNGQGADEVLAGYGSYFHARWVELARAGRLVETWHEIRDFSDGQGGDAPRRYRAVLQQAALTSLRGTAARWRSPQADRRRQLQNARQRRWLNTDLADHLPAPAPFDPNATYLRHSLLHSVRVAPLPLYLRVEDRNSMAHSVEARLPFLDHRLVQLAFGLRSQWKVRGRWNKHVLREAMRGRIPESVRSRVDKVGFSTSTGEWFRGVLKEPLRELVDAAGRAHPDFFDATELDQRLQARLDGRENNTVKLLAVVQFHIWQQQHAAPSSRPPMPRDTVRLGHDSLL
jgi:asparagine synthase (glutamine-hydrolysing)